MMASIEQLSPQSTAAADIDAKLTAALGGHGVWTATALREVIARAGFVLSPADAQQLTTCQRPEER
jgi:hypothetical protein